MISEDNKFLPGEGSFIKLFDRTKKYFRVDKTPFINVLESTEQRCVLFLAPRRFGKTLWLDTLAQYYDEQNKDKFDELFGHLEIGKYRTDTASSYQVLKLDLARIDDADNFKADFHVKLNEQMEVFKTKYNYTFSTSNDCTVTLIRLIDTVNQNSKKVREKFYSWFSFII
jgi:hypothetical protein